MKKRRRLSFATKFDALRQQHSSFGNRRGHGTKRPPFGGFAQRTHVSTRGPGEPESFSNAAAVMDYRSRGGSFVAAV
ncbi:MAG: hypothetical protein EBR00_06135 [Gammaproteobacteria bacterium]|nr:hypothetical protein [Gammaproteobacteria bacterium]